MRIHHDKHHGAYVTNLNKAIADKEIFNGKSLEQICEMVTADMAAVRNNGGGHYNHSKFWKWIAPGGAKAPSGELANAINSAFGSFDEMKKQFSEAAKTRFGSGWAWLSADKTGKLLIESTANQDSPIMHGNTPLLGLDVWEHAYYLLYQNRRADYVGAFYNVIDWDAVGQRFATAKK
jgi:Fe-Mn family superoxide dismutase